MKALLTHASRFLPILLWALVIYLFSALPDPYRYISGLAAGQDPPVYQSTPGEVTQPNTDISCNLGGATDMSGVEAHIVEFAVLSALIARALVWQRRPTFWRLSVAFLLAALYAVSDELHQMYVPGRGCELVDFWMDLVGAGVGIGIYLMIKRLKKPPPDEFDTGKNGMDHSGNFVR